MSDSKKFNGKIYSLTKFSRWAKYYTDESGKFHLIISRLLEGDFDFSYFEKFKPSDLSPLERRGAASAIKVALPNHLIPKEWVEFAEACTK